MDPCAHHLHMPSQPRSGVHQMWLPSNWYKRMVNEIEIDLLTRRTFAHSPKTDPVKSFSRFDDFANRHCCNRAFVWRLRQRLRHCIFRQLHARHINGAFRFININGRMQRCDWSIDTQKQINEYYYYVYQFIKCSVVGWRCSACSICMQNAPHRSAPNQIVIYVWQ